MQIFPVLLSFWLPSFAIYNLFKIPVVSLSVCYVTALFWASIVSSFPHVCYMYVTICIVKVSTVSLFVCFVVALFWVSAVSSSVYYVTILFLQGFQVSLSVCYFIALFSDSNISSYIWYVNILFLRGFHCFAINICLLRHCSVLGFSCLFCVLRHYTVSSRRQLLHCLFVTSLS